MGTLAEMKAETETTQRKPRPPYVQAEIDAAESKAEQIEHAIDALDSLKGIYPDVRRHELRVFTDQLRVDAHNFRSAAAKLRQS